MRHDADVFCTWMFKLPNDSLNNPHLQQYQEIIIRNYKGNTTRMCVFILES